MAEIESTIEPGELDTARGHGDAKAERRRVMGVADFETKKADPQRESAFNSGSGGAFIEKLDLYAEPFPLVALI